MAVALFSAAVAFCSTSAVANGSYGPLRSPRALSAVLCAHASLDGVRALWPAALVGVYAAVKDARLGADRQGSGRTTPAVARGAHRGLLPPH
eukprot:6111411-Alexandrium_andersonii.AAC.1